MMLRAMVAGLFIGIVASAHAEGSLFKVPTRDGVATTLFWETAPDAKATVFLFPGGGEIGNEGDAVRHRAVPGEIGLGARIARAVDLAHGAAAEAPDDLEAADRGGVELLVAEPGAEALRRAALGHRTVRPRPRIHGRSVTDASSQRVPADSPGRTSV